GRLGLSGACVNGFAGFSHRLIPMVQAPIMATIATRPSTVHYLGASPSLAAELAWVLNLLVQTAGYAEPALDELERTLLPGVMALRPKVRDRFSSVFRDTLRGCPELLIAAAMGDCLADQEPRRLLGWLSTLPKKKPA